MNLELAEELAKWLTHHKFSVSDAALLLQIPQWRLWLYLAGLSYPDLFQDLYLIGRMIAVSHAEELVSVL